MIRFVALTLIAAALAAQDSSPAPKPPAKTDQALRARITEFYQDFVSGRFREAQALVAKDTLDYYFSVRKDRYLGFAIQSITYSKDFKSARASVICERMLMMPGFAGQALKMPVLSEWKIEKGKWYWYVPKEDGHVTPFGRMGAAASNGAPSPAGAQPRPAMPVIPASPDFALHKVKADKETLSLKSGEAGEVTFSNSAPGVMSITLEGKLSGIEVAPEKADLKEGGTVTLTVKRLQDAQAGNLVFRVFPTGEAIAVKIELR